MILPPHNNTPYYENTEHPPTAFCSFLILHESPFKVWGSIHRTIRFGCNPLLPPYCRTVRTFKSKNSKKWFFLCSGFVLGSVRFTPNTPTAITTTKKNKDQTVSEKKRKNGDRNQFWPEFLHGERRQSNVYELLRAIRRYETASSFKAISVC